MIDLLLIAAASFGISEEVALEKYEAYCDYLYMSQQVESFETLECNLDYTHNTIKEIRSGTYNLNK